MKAICSHLLLLILAKNKAVKCDTTTFIKIQLIIYINFINPKMMH